MGLTFLTWGISFCDVLVNLAVVKRGLPEMALTGCYSAPLFNTLIALGLTSMREMFNTGVKTIVLPVDDPNVKIPLVMCVFIVF